MSKLEAVTGQLEKAVGRLKQALAEPPSEMARDSAIQRFEFSLDLSWKTLKSFLEEKKGIVCSSPKDCFREAYRQGVIKYDEEWLKFVDLRNETVHTYNEAFAEQVYAQLLDALKHFEYLLEAIKATKLRE